MHVFSQAASTFATSAGHVLPSGGSGAWVMGSPRGSGSCALSAHAGQTLGVETVDKYSYRRSCCAARVRNGRKRPCYIQGPAGRVQLRPPSERMRAFVRVLSRPHMTLCDTAQRRTSFLRRQLSLRASMHAVYMQYAITQLLFASAAVARAWVRGSASLMGPSFFSLVCMHICPCSSLFS